VSRSWIYTRPELRELIEQLAAPRIDMSAESAHRASDESLRRRLALAHQRISQLNNENQQVRKALAQAHGHSAQRARPHDDGLSPRKQA
jgi:hypothetical protein